jgi:hypothetical protein
MPKTTSPPAPDDPAEYQRFIDMAHEVEADETPGALDRAFKRVIGRKVPNDQDKSSGKDR